MRRSLALVALAACTTGTTELGAFVASAPARFATPPQAVASGTTAVERSAPEPASARGRVVGGESRLGGELGDHLVAGVEVAIGAAHSTARDAATTSSALYLGAAALVGLTARVGRFSIGTELAAGMRSLERLSADGSAYYFQRDLFVEPRVRVHVWATPWLAIGIYGALDAAGIRVIGRIPEPVIRSDLITRAGAPRGPMTAITSPR